jgi:hypothetical protein
VKITAMGDRRDSSHRPVATVERIRSERHRAGDIRLDPRRRRRPLHDVPDGMGRFVGQGLAQVTGEVQLHIRGLTIGALRARRREWIAPEILDVLHMLRISSN